MEENDWNGIFAICFGFSLIFWISEEPLGDLIGVFFIIMGIANLQFIGKYLPLEELLKISLLIYTFVFFTTIEFEPNDWNEYLDMIIGISEPLYSQAISSKVISSSLTPFLIIFLVFGLIVTTSKKSNEKLAKFVGMVAKNTKFGSELENKVKSLHRDNWNKTGKPNFYSNTRDGFGGLIGVAVISAFYTLYAALVIAYYLTIAYLFLSGIILLAVGYVAGLICFLPVIILGMIFG